jgi:magnesium-protoporphyrin IX monomethyl ester (oxidative) cyclase
MVIKLINMPFGHLAMPSLALTQLKAVLDSTFGDAVDVEIIYLNMDVAQTTGMRSLYNHVLSTPGFMTGIGDWLFRQVAFPDSPDNSEAYLERYYFDDSDVSREVRAYVRGPRQELGNVLDALIERYRLHEADLVGCTSLFSQTVPSAALARRIKAVAPGVVTVLGGAACEGKIGHELVRQVDAIDYVSNGPALSSLPDLVTHLMSRDLDAVCRIPGMCAAGATTEVVPSAAYDHAWEQLPPPDYSDFLAALDRSFPDERVMPALLFQTSEGCWWGDKSKCSFCGLNAEECRSHTMAPGRAIQQFNALFAQGGAPPFLMAVDSIMPVEYPREVFSNIAPPPGTCIQYEVRPTLGADEIHILSDAGVRLLQPGIEALATSTLKLMKKGLTAFQNVQFLKHCSNHPITLRWNLLLFSPGESEETYETYLRQIPLLAHLHPPEGAFPINFVQNSRYLAGPESFGLQLEPQDFYGLTYPVEPDALCNLANVFVDRNADTERQDAWLASLNEAVGQWDARYFGSDGLPQARLVLFEEDGRSGIYDSRDGTETRYWIDEAVRDALLYLEQPRKQDDLQEAFSRVPVLLTELRSRRLLFEEDGRLLSLVPGDALLSQA